MKKNKIILIVGLIVLVIGLVFTYLYFSNKDIKTDEVKKYEVTEDEFGILLKVLDSFDIPKFKYPIIEHEKLKNVKKDISMQYVMNIIKDYDSTFKEEDYLLSFNGASVNGNIILTYYIDNKIETNKIYNVFSENNKVSYIMISGIKKENIANIRNVNTQELIELVANFKVKEKEEKIYKAKKGMFKTDKVLKNDNTLDISNIKSKVEKVEEKYFYDYNTKKLLYLAYLYESKENDSTDYVIEVEIN